MEEGKGHEIYYEIRKRLTWLLVIAGFLMIPYPGWAGVILEGRDSDIELVIHAAIHILVIGLQRLARPSR